MRRRAHIRRRYRVDVHSRSRAFDSLWFGIVAVLAGILLTLDNLGFIDARVFFRWWPALFIWAGVSVALKGRPVFGLIVGLFGFFLLLDNLNYIDLDFSDLWPLVLILLGVKVIWRHREERGGEGMGSEVNRGESGPASSGEEASTAWTSDDSIISAVAILGGVDRKCSSQGFKGGQLTAVMGGCEIDLREASIVDSPAVIDVFALWGGVELAVPEDWTVTMKTQPIMGGISDRTTAPRGGSDKNLILKGTVVMGGLEVKN